MPIIPITQMNAQAQSAYNAMSDQIKRDRAYNALREAYGPIAGDPAAALQMQQYQYNTQMQPLQVTNQELTNQALGNQNNYMTKAYPQMLENQKLTNQGQGITNALNQQKVGANAMAMDQAKGQQVQQALSASLANLDASLQGVEDPNMRAQVFDQQLARLAPMLGTSPEQLRQQMTPQRDAVIAQGRMAIPAIKNDLDGMLSGGLTAADRLAAQKAAADLQMANVKLEGQKIDNQTARMKAVDTAQQDLADITAKQDALGFMNQRVAAMTEPIQNPDGTVQPGLIGQARELMKEVSGNPIQRKIAARIQGTPEYQLEKVLGQIGHNLSLDDLRNLKATGVSLGRVTNVEFLATAEAIANFDIGQDPQKLKGDLSRVEETYSAMKESANKEIASLTERKQDLAKRVEQFSQTQASWGTPAATGGAPKTPAQANQPINVTQVIPQDKLRGDYMRVNATNGDPREPGWYAKNITSIPVPNGQKLNVNRQSAAAFQGFLQDLAATGYELKDVQSYNLRSKRNSDDLSQHAFANAIDVNPEDMPMGGTENTLPEGVADLAAKWGLRWGGMWKGDSYDPMHFEWTGNVTPAMAALRQQAGGQYNGPADQVGGQDNGVNVSAAEQGGQFTPQAGPQFQTAPNAGPEVGPSTAQTYNSGVPQPQQAPQQQAPRQSQAPAGFDPTQYIRPIQGEGSIVPEVEQVPWEMVLPNLPSLAQKYGIGQNG